MNIDNDNLMEDGPEDLNDYPLSVQFSARRALLNAQVQAKITDGTYKPKKIICRFTPSASFSKWLDKNPDYGLKLGHNK